jgi:hypothetical protein
MTMAFSYSGIAQQTILTRPELPGNGANCAPAIKGKPPTGGKTPGGDMPPNKFILAPG